MKPKLTVNGFVDILETTTEVSIGIVDDSAVETKVLHDGEEIVVSSEKQFNLTINPYGIPFVNYSPDFYAYGYKYFTESYEGDDFQTILNIKYAADRPICIRTNRWGGSRPKFDGKNENYKYIFLTPEVGNKGVQIEPNELLTSENNISLIFLHKMQALYFLIEMHMQL